MPREDLAEQMVGLTERMRFIHAEFERCRRVLHDELAPPEDVFAARWLMREIQMGMEESLRLAAEIEGRTTT